MRGALALVAAFVWLAAPGCSSDPGTNVVLGEWVVEPDPTSVDSGEVELTGDNQGGEIHELVVVKADSASDLPTDSDGAVIEDDLPDGALIGEIEDIESQSSKSVTLDLEPGSYVLICNIVEEEESGEIESHFAEGMFSEFTVN